MFKKPVYSFYILNIICFLMAGFLPITSLAMDKQLKVYQLMYQEREPGVDPYEVRMLVADKKIRIDTMDDDSGYIVYDDESHTIFSVSHYDKKILVIKPRKFKAEDSGIKSTTEYLQLSDAPKVSGKSIYNYSVHAGEGKAQQTCIDLQLVEGLLPEVTKILKNYQKVISGQQVQLLKKTIKDVQTPCYLVDQIYNEGTYYDKGLPIQEWHSNEKSKILMNYKQVKIKSDIFDLPEGYARFSIAE